MFEIAKQTAKLNHINVRTENHGQEEVVANDLTFFIKTSNKILNLLNENLLPFFYTKNGSSEELDLEEDHCPDLRLASFISANTSGKSGFKFDYTGKGYDVTLHVGLDQESWIELTDCTISHITYWPLADGIVEMKLNVSLCPNSRERAVFQDHLKETFEITLTAPAAEIFGEGGQMNEAAEE